MSAKDFPALDTSRHGAHIALAGNGLSMPENVPSLSVRRSRWDDPERVALPCPPQRHKSRERGGFELRGRT